MPFLRGAFLGVLTEMRRLAADDLAAELTAYARGPVDQQMSPVIFFTACSAFPGRQSCLAPSAGSRRG